MNTRPKGSPPPPAAFALHDVYYILFRHKWLIAVLAALGIASGAVVHSLWTFPYTSEAKIFIRYIQDTTAPAEMGGTAKVRSPDDRGANILNTVSYEDGPHVNPQGSLKEGETVKVKNGMIFNVTATDKS